MKKGVRIVSSAPALLSGLGYLSNEREQQPHTGAGYILAWYIITDEGATVGLLFITDF